MIIKFNDIYKNDINNNLVYMYNIFLMENIENTKSFSNEFDDEMFVKKRDGEMEVVAFDKILRRIRTIGTEVGIKINYTSLAMKVIDQLYSGISTTKIDELSAQQCASLASTHPDYNVLAGRITISNHHKNTSSSFVDVMTELYEYKDTHGKSSPLLSADLFDVVQKYKDEWENILDYERDYLIDYFGFKTLERAYLMQVNKVTVERPQHMWLRVSIGIHGDNMEKIRTTYEYMSQKYFTHATPTLFNAGTPHPQLSSCFLLSMENDSIEGIYNTLKDCALISKWAGGIGLHIHNVRASGSHIRGTNGSSNGIVPMLKVFNNTAKYVDQCVLPTTIIYTKQGPMHISKCISGVTEIFNRTGNLETIDNVLEHAWSGNIVEVTLFEHLSNPLSITPEHPIYVLQNCANKDENEIQNDLDLGLTKFEWTDAKDVTPNDGIVYSIPQYQLDFASLTEEICYFYGIILAGLILYNENKSNVRTDPNNMYVMQIPAKIEELADFLSYMNIPYEIKIQEYYNVIIWEKTVNLPFRHSDFYYSSNTDCFAIGQRWLFLPTNKTEKILAGFEKVNIYNESIIHYVFFLKLRLGNIENSIRYKNFLIVQVQRVMERHYNGSVYDLQMTDQHNYLLNGGLVHNGGGKRNGSFAIYLEPWHADIELFLQMRKNHGDEELKARDLFYALWVPDLFMERIKADGTWTLMCPDECPGLADVYGDDFVNLYTKYEAGGKGKKTVKARELWFQILDAQMETGTPYLLYKDACNKKSNQKNVGTIKSSNLCTEILEYSDENETAVCNLASIGLPTFVDRTTNPPTFNYEKLHDVSQIVTYNLNKIIDVNYYPTQKTERSNKRHRPIGIGVQGLADVFMMMNLPFSGDEAKMMNKMIFETIYHGALTESCNIAKIEGKYETFDGSPASHGELQFDLWNVEPCTTRYDWTNLKNEIKEHGLRNSLLLAPMPTASTSQILGFNECIEPITSNIYSRRTIAGEFILANKYLMNDLIALDLWNEKIKNNIIANHGSIQQLEMIPPEIKEKYKTVWEIPMRNLIDMAADRGAYICQSQSLNLWLEDPNYSNLTSMHFYSWSKGLKTGIYYLRRRGRHQPQQVTIEPEKKEHSGTMEDDDICEMCSPL
jgi:ribonucleoside-diphosphate reductase alpha subunit